MTIPYDTVLEKGQIRLLQVTSVEKEGADQPVVTCTQKIVDLASEPEYYALSYTWDLPYKRVVWENDKIKEIAEGWDQEDVPPDGKFVVDGKELWTPPNLFFSLSTFPDIISASWIWIDAICIRQNDEAEKAMQVQAMKDIYASAVGVLISLGVEDWKFPHGSMDDVLEVVDCFVPHLQTAIAADRDILPTLVPSSLADASFEAKIGITSLAKKMMAFAEFCTIFRWFNRLWCIQEVVLARTVAVRCGERMVSWDAMEDLTSVLRHQQWDVWLAGCIAKTTGYGGSHLSWCRGLASMCALKSAVHSLDPTKAAYRRMRLRGSGELGILLQKESITALSQGTSPVSRPLKKPTQADPVAFSLCARLLTIAQSAACSNELDRVYGFLGVFDAVVAEDVSTLVPVDYTESVSNLYLKVMTLLMEKSETIDLVTFQFPEFRDRQQQSSWIIDLRMPLPKSQVLGALGDGASRGTKEAYESKFGHILPFKVYHQELHVFGGDLDRITHILDPKDSTAGGSMLKVLWQLANILPSKILKRPRLESVWRTLIQNRWAVQGEKQRADDDVEMLFLHCVVLEEVSRLANQDKEKKAGNVVLEAHVRRFANIVSQFDLVDGSFDLDHAYHVDILRQSLRETCTMNELNRDPIRHHQQVRAELVQLESDGMITAAQHESVVRSMNTRPDVNLPPRLVQSAASYDRSMAQGMSPGRILFVSERGLLGSAPKSTKVGDSIWILCGATAPWVLRPIQEDCSHMPGAWPGNERYQFVGDTFILDMMDGEALQREEFELSERLRRVTIV